SYLTCRHLPPFVGPNHPNQRPDSTGMVPARQHRVHRPLSSWSTATDSSDLVIGDECRLFQRPPESALLSKQPVMGLPLFSHAGLWLCPTPEAFEIILTPTEKSSCRPNLRGFQHSL